MGSQVSLAVCLRSKLQARICQLRPVVKKRKVIMKELKVEKKLYNARKILRVAEAGIHVHMGDKLLKRHAMITHEEYIYTPQVILLQSNKYYLLFY